MKKITILFTVCLGLLLSSCEDFLDRQPKSTLSISSYWQTKQDLDTWNAGMYDGLQATLRYNWFYWGDVRSGVYAERGTAYDRNLLYNGLTSQSGSSNWNTIYNTVYRANAAIKYIPTSPVSVIESNVYLAQAYAMRALMYFYAIRVWGDVPKITEPTEELSTQQRYYGRTSVAELKDFILDDLDKAIQCFGESKNMASAQKYYLNRGSAMAIKIDVLMWYKEYDRALAQIKDLESNYGYQLEPTDSYVSMFLGPDKSREMIFNLYWSSSEDGGGFGYAQEIASGSNTIRYHPTKAMFQELVRRKKEDMRVNLVMDTFAISYFITPDEIAEDSYERAYSGNYGNIANFLIKCPKFTEYGSTANDNRPGYVYQANGDCSTHMPVYRLADILLLKAEALVLGTTKDYQGAIDIVNRIRKRARWSNEAVLANYPTEKDIIKLIIDERTVELWGEGKRWFDLVRNDLVKEYLDPYLQNPDLGEFTNPDGFVVGAEKPSPNHIGGYGKILWPLNQDVFRKNPAMSGQQNKPYEE